jgi:hypothetical protein
MHNNSLLIEKLFTSLDKHDHQSMADCYSSEARFKDIASDLYRRKNIHAMWHMICDGGSNIRVILKTFEADEQAGKAELIDEYTFSDTGNHVTNKITSHFKFEDGLIVEQHDICDAEEWARQALGGLKGFIAGKLGVLRRLMASKKLREFIGKHPQHQ